MRICFTIGGHRYCIWIPILIWPPWPPRPNGDPWKHIGEWVETPDPQQWRENLTILASVAALGEHAHGDLKGRLQELVHAEAAAIQKQLPEGVQLEMGAKR
jgi:hypothetical protein